MTEDPEIVNLDEPNQTGIVGWGRCVICPDTVSTACPLLLAVGDRGFVATTTFASKYRIRVEIKVGMKVAILSCLAGFGASTAVHICSGWPRLSYRT